MASDTDDMVSGSPRTEGGAAAALRAEMVAGLRRRQVLSDPRVEAALLSVPRHVFVPGVTLSEAYDDRAIPTRYERGVPTSSASQPAIVATMLEQLNPPAEGSVLEIGAGTGYNAALLSVLVGPSGRVVTVDIQREVSDEARGHLSDAGVANVTVVCGDGAAGFPEGAPYDGIIATAGVSDLAPAWIDQLAADGRLVVPLSIGGVQQCVAFARVGAHLGSVSVCDCGFMPLVGAMANSDPRRRVPGRRGVYLETAPESKADPAVVAAVLGKPGATMSTGVSASGREVYGSLRRWLAFEEETALALLTYIGPSSRAGASRVPPLIQFPSGRFAQRFSPCIVGSAGFAVLDEASAPDDALDADPAHSRPVELATRAYGGGNEEAVRLCQLVRAWDAAGRPRTDRLHIDAYPSGTPPTGASGRVHAAPHTTFVVSLASEPRR